MSTTAEGITQPTTELDQRRRGRRKITLDAYKHTSEVSRRNTGLCEHFSRSGSQFGAKSRARCTERSSLVGNRAPRTRSSTDAQRPPANLEGTNFSLSQIKTTLARAKASPALAHRHHLKTPRKLTLSLWLTLITALAPVNSVKAGDVLYSNGSTLTDDPTGSCVIFSENFDGVTAP